jgi:hypothetical protein
MVVAGPKSVSAGKLEDGLIRVSFDTSHEDSRYAFSSDLVTNNRFWRSMGTLNFSIASR